MNASKIINGIQRTIELGACAFLFIMTLAFVVLAGSCAVCMFTDPEAIGINLLGAAGSLIMAALSWGAFTEFRHERA